MDRFCRSHYAQDRNKQRSVGITTLVMQPQRKLQNPRPIGLACDNSKGHRGIHIGRRSRKLNPVEQVERFHTELHASACSNAHQVYWKTTLRYNLKP
jgi:hypothetical protein